MSVLLRVALSFSVLASVAAVAATPDAVRLELVGAWGGAGGAVTAVGDWFYVGIGSRVVLLDVSSPTNPVVLAESPPLPLDVMRIAVQGSLVYVADSYAGSVFACIVGIGLAYGLMALLSSATIELKDNPFSMFFVNKHLYFFPTAASIIGNFVVIVLVSFLIAFFTARRAARLRVADALRHFE